MKPPTITSLEVCELGLSDRHPLNIVNFQINLRTGCTNHSVEALRCRTDLSNRRANHVCLDLAYVRTSHMRKNL